MSNVQDNTQAPSGHQNESDTPMSSRHADQQGGNESALGPGPAQFTGNDMTGVISAGDSGPDSIPGVVADVQEGADGTEGKIEAVTSENGGSTTTNVPGQGGTTFGPGTSGFGSGSGGAGGPTITGGNTST